MKTTGIVLAIIALLAASINLGGCNSRNIPAIKAGSLARYKEAGYTVIGYEGYATGDFVGGAPGGEAWYTVRGPDGVVYTSSCRIWNGEVQLYHLTPINPSVLSRR